MNEQAEANLGSGKMFDAIAHRYDLVNRVMSFGIDKRWRRLAVDALQISGAARVLDVATGTADLAIAIAKQYTDTRVDGVDPSVGMLTVGEEKIQQQGLSKRVHLQEGDAQALPFEDDSFDGVTISFGIRNVPDRQKGLLEMTRVVRPGGRVVVLELGEPTGVLGPFARLHVHTLVPAIGAVISGRHKEYNYLQNSIAAFPTPDVFSKMMEDAGLVDVTATPLTFSACVLFVGTVPEAAKA